MRGRDEDAQRGITLLSILLILAIVAIVIGVAVPLFLGGSSQAGSAAKDKLSAAYQIAADTRSPGGEYAAGSDIAAAISQSDTDLGDVSVIDSISALQPGQTAVISSGTSDGPGSSNSKDIEMAYQGDDGVIWILKASNGGPPLYSSVTPAQDTYAQTILDDNPLSYWPLDDQSRPLAANSVEGAPNGTYFGGISVDQTRVQPGSPSAPVGFNGSTGYVDLGPQMDPADYTDADGSGWSTELWVRLDDVSAQQFIWSRYLATKAAAGAGTYIYYDPSKGFVCGTALGDGKYPMVTTGNGSVVADKWYHIVCELDPNQKAKNIMYVDNTQYVTDWTSSLKSVMPPKTTYDHLLGQNDASSWLDGYLSNVAFYAYPLSSETVAAHYAKGTSAPPASEN